MLCLPSVHVDDIKGTARRDVAEPLLAHLNELLGQCKADYSCFLHTGIQHEHPPGFVFTHQHVYIDSTTPSDKQLLVGKGDEEACPVALREAHRSVLGAVAWTVLTRVDLAVYVQLL